MPMMARSPAAGTRGTWRSSGGQPGTSPDGSVSRSPIKSEHFQPGLVGSTPVPLPRRRYWKL